MPSNKNRRQECKSVVRNGKARKHQRYKCKECGLTFIEGNRRQKTPAEAKALAVLLYGMGKSSYGFIAKLFKVSRTAVYHWIRNFGEDIPPPQVPEASMTLNLMRCGIMSLQKNKLWIWKALDRHEGKPLAWVTGHRNAQTFFKCRFLNMKI